MPELPEVETTRLGIAPHLIDKTIISITVREPRLRQLVTTNLHDLCVNQKIKQVTRRAKYILIHLTDGVLLVHLGMSGHLRFVAADSKPLKHDHIDICLQPNLVLRYQDPRRFGLLLYLTGDINSHPLLRSLGPEPLESDFNSNYLYKRVQGRKQAIKSFLMNSQVVVGVGNIYASESLFYAQVNPQLPAGKITKKQSVDLVHHIKKVLQQSIKAGGTTLRDFFSSDGKPGYFANELMVYGRSNQPCPKCTTPIQSIFIGGRNSFFCPSCQNTHLNMEK